MLAIPSISLVPNNDLFPVKRIVIWLAVLITVIFVAARLLQPRPQPLPPPAPVVIEDRKTIDFSSGAPVVKGNAEEQALIDAAMKDITEAAKNIRFAPLAPVKVEIAPEQP